MNNFLYCNSLPHNPNNNPTPPPTKKRAMKMLKRYSLPSLSIGAGCWYSVANSFFLQNFPVHWWLLSHVLWDCNLGTHLCILRYNVSSCCFITCRHNFSYDSLIYSLSWRDSLIAFFDHINFYLFSSGPNAEGLFMVHVGTRYSVAFGPEEKDPFWSITAGYVLELLGIFSCNRDLIYIF